MIPKAVITRINEINALIPMMDELSDYPTTYAGSTHEMYVMIKEIRVNNQFVTIVGDDNMYNFIKGKERYNTNKKESYDDMGLSHLKYDLSIILKSFKKAIKNN